jgi:hypothetical protein
MLIAGYSAHVLTIFLRIASIPLPYSFLYKLLVPLAQSRIRHQVQQLVGERITNAVKYLERQIARVQENVAEMQHRRRETEKSRGEHGISPEEAEEKRKQRAPWESEAFEPRLQAVH